MSFKVKDKISLGNGINAHVNKILMSGNAANREGAYVHAMVNILEKLADELAALHEDIEVQAIVNEILVIMEQEQIEMLNTIKTIKAQEAFKESQVEAESATRLAAAIKEREKTRKTKV